MSEWLFFVEVCFEDVDLSFSPHHCPNTPDKAFKFQDTIILLLDDLVKFFNALHELFNAVLAVALALQYVKLRWHLLTYIIQLTKKINQ